MKFLSHKPKVKVVDFTRRLSDTIVASARTCYSHAPIFPDDVDWKEGESRKHWDTLFRKLFFSEHHTPFQNTDLVLALDGISRLLIWAFLHDHPYHNSNQVSQRFRELLPESKRYKSLSLEDRLRSIKRNFVIPDLEDENLNRKSIEMLDKQVLAYEELVDLIWEDAEKDYISRFPHQKGTAEGKLEVRKAAQEIARYVIAVASNAHLYHTINSLVLQRYIVCANMCQIPNEANLLVDMIVKEVERIDPRILLVDKKDQVSVEKTVEFLLSERKKDGKIDFGKSKEFVEDFDGKLNGHRSLLKGYSSEAYEILGDAVREVLGLIEKDLSDLDVIDLLMNPASGNPYLTGPLNITMMSPIERALNHVSYTFRKKISHTCDSQDQRHRTVPGTRPFLLAHYTGSPDYITPDLIGNNEKALKLYEQNLRETFDVINEFVTRGVPAEAITYLLPNAFPVRFTESGRLLDLRKKLIERLCWNSQKEIWQVSADEREQLLRVHPEIWRYVGAPCDIHLMANHPTRCPDGYHFCGVKVWEIPHDQRERVI